MSTLLPTIRCSSLPLAFVCGAAMRPEGGVLVSSSNPAAHTGTAAHEGLQSLAENGAVDWDALDGIAAKHGVDAKEVRILCALGTRLWKRVSTSFRGALSEVSLSHEVAPGFVVTGHVDLLSVQGTVARAADWKTGRKDSDYSQQMRGYAALILLDDPSLTEVTVTVLWVRDEEIENYTMTREGLEVWISEVKERIYQWDGHYRTGDHCAHCPRNHQCEAFTAVARRDLAIVTEPSLVERVDGSLALMSPVEIVGLFRKVDLVAKVAERVREAIKRQIEEGGDIEADGVRLTVSTEKRRDLIVDRAWPVLESLGFGDEEFARVITLRPSEIETIVKERAGRGKGAAAIRDLARALDEAEAVSFRELKKLQARRA